MGLETVPFIEEFVFDSGSIADLEKYASQFKYENGNPAEGVVIRAWVPRLPAQTTINFMPAPLEKMHAMLSFKVINPNFKLKYQDEE
jgi:hypothetical protein